MDNPGVLTDILHQGKIDFFVFRKYILILGKELGLMEEVQYPYDSRQIANWFIRRAPDDGQSMSIMHVLKLVYMAHGWTLATLDRPLIMDRICLIRFSKCYF